MEEAQIAPPQPTEQVLNGITNGIPASHVPKSTAAAQAPIQREQREKKETLKKREASAGFSAATTLGKRKASNGTAAYPTPIRISLDPKAADFEPPKEDVLLEHEGYPLFVPGQDRQLYKPDTADNKKNFRYARMIADPQFPHKQFYRSTSPPPHYAHFSYEDADKWMHFTNDALCTTNEKGWRMARANVCAREGTLYYEVRVHRGVPQEGPELGRTTPAPRVRFGWARREAALDAPVGFDGYSYGITDARFETIHRSRPGKFFQGLKKGQKAKIAKTTGPTTITMAPEDQHVKEGEVIGVEIQLPSLDLHQKIVTGVYNPAVDIGDGFDNDDASNPKWRGPDDVPADVIRDRVTIQYKGHAYSEVIEVIAAKPVEMYADRTTNLTSITAGHGPSSTSKEALRAPPNPNHEEATLRTLPHSAIRVYKNGKLIGTAFENLLAFLPPASTTGKQPGARDETFDDGMIGYYPAVACFAGGVAEINLGDGERGFWAPPPHLSKLIQPASNGDVELSDASNSANSSARGWNPGSTPRAVGDRYKEQIAEDIVWDIVDEVDFYVQDDGIPKAN